MLDTPPLSLYRCPALSEYSLCETDSSKAEEWAEHLVGHGFPSFVLPEVLQHTALCYPFHTTSMFAPWLPSRLSRTPVLELVPRKL